MNNIDEPEFLMWILNLGRKDFLEFLRNTSIQFFLMVLVLISSEKTNALISKQNYRDGIPIGLICAMIFAFLYLAAHANIKNFFIAFRAGATPDLDSYIASLAGQDFKRKNRMIFTFLLRSGKAAFVEACLLIMGIYFVMIFGFFYSIENAQSFISKENSKGTAAATVTAPKQVNSCKLRSFQ
ncbi:hypothetical protein [Pseudomonas syringae]|uniref:hypothetical protein n=1 Tax=Pseudomonas syringae TaxID=317 RepID=UPI0011AF329C|nr:hypothetical protein [Pseudomonas syringae]